MSGNNVTASGDLAATGTTFSVTDTSLPWNLETTTRTAGLVEQIDFTRNYTINSTTTSLSVFSSVSPVLAEGDTNNNSNPVAAATGNVTNQAVQFQNNGAPSRQAFGNNISCNGSTMTFSPFYMGNDTEPETEDGYVISENWGFQINFMIPLNRDLTKQ